jgi:hypothetical protein
MSLFPDIGLEKQQFTYKQSNFASNNFSLSPLFIVTFNFNKNGETQKTEGDSLKIMPKIAGLIHSIQ